MKTGNKIKKSILILSDINIDSGFGKEYVVYNFAKELSTEYNVSLFESNTGEKKNNFNEELSSLGVKIFFFNNLLGSILPYTFDSILMLFGLLKGLDAVYLAESDLFTDILMIVFRKFLKFKVFRGYHNPLEYNLLPDGRVISKYSLRRLYYKLILKIEKNFDGIHVENSDQKRILHQMGYRKVVLIHPYVLKNIPTTPITKYDDFSIIFLGRLNYHKGSDLIPSIIDSILNAGVIVNIYIAGDGILSNQIKEFCSRHDNCKFLGFISTKEKENYLSKCHILVAPTRVEAFMITGIEAMSLGTPVISFPVPGPNDYVINGENGFIVNGVTELSDKVEEIYSDFTSDRYSRYIENCINTAKEYTLDAGSGKYLELMNELLF